MLAHWQYLRYVVRHKWYVFLVGCRLGVPWLALLHDNSKFNPSEWFPYVDFFYGKDAKERQRRDSTGYYKPYDTGNEAFDLAWLYHQNRNKHHWQYWTLMRDDGGTRMFPMPDRYRREMIADWIGAGKAQGKHSPKDDPYLETRNWYNKNKDKMQLHQETRDWVEQMIGVTSVESDSRMAPSLAGD